MGETLGGGKEGRGHGRKDRGQMRVGNASIKGTPPINLQEGRFRVLDSILPIFSSKD